MERRGHRFVRYADDSNVYVRSERAGQRVMASLTAFITKRLKLKVNAQKSAVARPGQRKFLGFSFMNATEPKRRIAPTAQPSRVPPFEITMEPKNDCAVEYLVRELLLQQADGATNRDTARATARGTTIYYVENTLVNSLFGLLCWRAIFAPVPGAFFHDFQYAPADLSSGHFYQRRQREFAACLAELESDQYKATIRQHFATKAGIQSPFVSWGTLSRQLLDRALWCFPAAHLRLWFEWIARDVTENRAGFPDLVQFWPKEQRYRMIEVKGPGDRLQDNQRRLLEFCVSHQMPVSVCHVRWAGS